MKSREASPAGNVAIEGDLGSLHFTRELAHPPERVWEALTDPAQFQKWFFAADVGIEGRVGGSVSMVTGPARFEWTGRILAWEPPRVYEYELNADARPELPKGERTIVRWELSPSERGTKLVLTHRRLTKATALGFGPGTHALLDRLEALLDDAPLPDWMTRYEEVKGGYPSWGGAR